MTITALPRRDSVIDRFSEPTRFAWHFSSHHPVTTLTDAQLRQCDNDHCPAKPERCLPEKSRSSGPVLFDKLSCSANVNKPQRGNATESVPKPPQNGNLGRKSDLSPYPSS